VPYFSRRVLLIGGNIEASGRDARHDFFNEVADEHGLTRIAVAHTQSDRAETFLINLLRGSGLEGLASMSPVSGRIVRPLIEVSRGEIEAFLRQQNQSWRIDRSNLDPSFARNRLRHSVMPELAAQFNPNLAQTL